jgi:thiamine transporter
MESIRARQRTTVLVEIALSLALAVVLNAFKLWHMPQGGTVSLVMLPLFVLALRRGPGVGLAAGALYGLLDAMMDSFVVHPVQYVVDYPLAYALCGLAGLLAPVWRRSVDVGTPGRGVWTAIIPGVVIGSIARYTAHVASGIVYFAEFAPAGQPIALYSLAYNSFVLVSAVGCAAAAAVVLPALARVLPDRHA